MDDHSCLAYTEILEDVGVALLWERANAYFRGAGVTVKRVLTDNGPVISPMPSPMLGEWTYAWPGCLEARRVAAFPHRLVRGDYAFHSP